MRKIFCYSQSLLNVYLEDFKRDTNKFFRASKLTMDHIGNKFDYKGSEYELVGRIDDRDVCCKKSEDGSYWALDRIAVQRCIMGETNKVFPGQRRLRKLESVEQSSSEVESSDANE